MKKYKVEYSGFVYINAENEAEAIEKYEDDQTVYRECERGRIKEVSCFEVTD